MSGQTKQISEIVRKFSIEEIKEMLGGWEKFNSDFLKKWGGRLQTEESLNAMCFIPLLKKALKLKNRISKK